MVMLTGIVSYPKMSIQLTVHMTGWTPGPSFTGDGGFLLPHFAVSIGIY